MRSLSIALILVLSVTLPVTAHAAWSLAGNPVSIAANDQQFPTIVSDGAGGSIITWQDQRGSTRDIYAQRLNAAGVPQWTPDGVALCTAVGDQWEPKIVSDGAGGAIVTWYDNRGGSTADIYAQRVDAAGVVQWGGDGVALCTATDDQVVPTIVSDNAGGAIVTWHDRRTTLTYDIYAQRVDASGAVLWSPANGVGICTATGNQSLPTIDTDGAGGAIITWEDVRGGNSDIYVQRVDASGVPQWTPNGVGLCTLTSGQLAPTIVSDGAGGAIVAWRDGRSGAKGIYARRVSNLGAPQWTADGVALSTAGTFQLFQVLVSDGANGAIVAWQDNRSVTSYDVYARRVSDLGVPQWAANGVAIGATTNDQSIPTIASDGAGGAIITWNDSRSGTIAEIYAQRVNGLGAVQWLGNGIPVSNNASDRISPTLIPDGAGGAIVSWYDWRNGPTSDIYAQHINASGEIPTAVSGPARGPSLLVGQVYPNPFAATAWMDVEVATPSTVRIDVFDVAGQRVRVMTLSGAGSQRVEFDGRDNANRLLPSGVYFYRVKAAGETITRKMVIAR